MTKWRDALQDLKFRGRIGISVTVCLLYHFSLYQASLVNHLMEHVLIVSRHANIATLLSLLNAPAAQWANSFTCINAFLPNSVLQAHMRILRLGYVKIAQLDVPLAVLLLVWSALLVQKDSLCTNLSVWCAVLKEPSPGTLTGQDGNVLSMLVVPEMFRVVNNGPFNNYNPFN